MQVIVRISLACGVFLERRLQFIDDTHVVHHQAAQRVFENAVEPGNGLHQVMALWLVHVQGVDAGRIEAGQPHVTDDHPLGRIQRDDGIIASRERFF